MDLFLSDIVGKPALNPPKLITVVADNFLFIEDHARFLRTTFAAPSVKNLPTALSNDNILIQIGPLHNDIKNQVLANDWKLFNFEDFDPNQGICDRIAQALLPIERRSLIFINDISRIELSSENGYSEAKRLIALAENLRRTKQHFIVFLYQNCNSTKGGKMLLALEHVSHGVARAKLSCSKYLLHLWRFTKHDNHIETLLPPPVLTSYLLCKVGHFYWSHNLMCFYEKRTISKDHYLSGDADYKDPNAPSVELDDVARELFSKPGQSKAGDAEARKVVQSRRSEEEVTKSEMNATTSGTSVLGTDESRIFYYQDRHDDVDEDDPDDDLNV